MTFKATAKPATTTSTTDGNPSGKKFLTGAFERSYGKNGGKFYQSFVIDERTFSSFQELEIGGQIVLEEMKPEWGKKYTHRFIAKSKATVEAERLKYAKKDVTATDDTDDSTLF